MARVGQTSRRVVPWVLKPAFHTEGSLAKIDVIAWA